MKLTKIVDEINSSNSICDTYVVNLLNGDHPSSPSKAPSLSSSSSLSRTVQLGANTLWKK